MTRATREARTEKVDARMRYPADPAAKWRISSTEQHTVTKAVKP